MISGQFDTYTDPAHPTLPVVGLTSRVSEAVALLLSTHEGRRAARFPHKMLKLCRIAAAMNRDHSPLPKAGRTLALPNGGGLGLKTPVA